MQSSSSSSSSSSSTGTGGGIEFKSGLVVFITFVVILFDLFNFGEFWVGRYVAQGDWSQTSSYIQADMWPQFKQEAKYYQDQNILSAQILLESYKKIDRKSLGNAGPLLDFFFLKLLRAAAFMSYMVGGAIVLLFIVLEAMKRNKDKRLNFEHLSATIYHFTLNSAALTVGSVFFLFLFMPAQIFVPGLLDIGVPSFLCRPQLWVIMLTGMVGCIMYIMLSNLSYKA